MAEQTKNLTVRLPVDDYRLVESVAVVRDSSVTEVVLRAIEEHLRIVAGDEDFQRALEEQYTRTKSRLESLLDSGVRQDRLPAG